MRGRELSKYTCIIPSESRCSSISSMTLCFVAISTLSVAVRPSAVVFRSSLFKGNLKFALARLYIKNSREKIAHKISRFLENIEFASVSHKLN